MIKFDPNVKRKKDVPISKNKVMSFLCDLWYSCNEPYVNAETALEWAMDGVDDMTAFDGWILCEVEMPPVKTPVMATVLWTDYGDICVAYGEWKGTRWELSNSREGTLIKGFEVKAWMPCPSPYKE